MKRYDFDLIGPVSCIDAAYVDISSPCDPWKGSIGSGGYGIMYHPSTQNNIMVHRLEYAKSRGILLEALAEVKIRHICDNRACKNYRHLLAGTQAQNNGDTYRRSRTPLGESRPQAKLTEQTVEEIRARYKKGSREHGSSALAREFGVSQAAIWHVLTRRSWPHIP